MRRVLIAIVVLLVLLIGALGYFTRQWPEESQLTPRSRPRSRAPEVGSMQTDETKDATATAKKTDVPDRPCSA